jgi:NAD(P)-dependent dehydrogenase (short-subunit alcohol dehydrogenase family)
VGDVTDRSSLQHIVDVIKTQTGHIDLLVNNAGLARNFFPHPLPVPTPEAPSIEGFQHALWNAGTPEEFAATLETNVTAVYYTTVAFLGLLHEANVRRRTKSKDAAPPQLPGDLVPPPPYISSQVLTISSSGAFRIDSKVLSPSYTVAKCAETNLGKVFSNLLAPWGIRSNVLAPGVWPTGVFDTQRLRA